nr:kinesin-like protein [Tanacetum cinerariifolium]
MAMQASMGFSKIIILIGAGYTGTLLMQNGKLSDVLAELQALVKGYEGKRGDGENDHSDAIAAQVRRLAMEVRQMASSRQITVLNGGSGTATSLVVPAAALGAVGYGYMWWKGLSFSDLMYVTKQNMTNAVSNLTKHLEQVSDVVAIDCHMCRYSLQGYTWYESTLGEAAKKHLTQRIENLDGKMDQQVEISKLIRSEVNDTREDISQIGYDLDSLNQLVSGLNGKIMTLEEKQDLTNLGVWYLCNKADGNKMSGKAQEQFRLAGKSFTGFLEGVKEIAETLDPEDKSRMLTRRNTVKFSS